MYCVPFSLVGPVSPVRSTCRSSRFCFPISLLPCFLASKTAKNISSVSFAPIISCLLLFLVVLVELGFSSHLPYFLPFSILLSPLLFHSPSAPFFLNSLVSSFLSFSQCALISPCIPHSLEPQSPSIISLSPLSVIFLGFHMCILCTQYLSLLCFQCATFSSSPFIVLYNGQSCYSLFLGSPNFFRNFSHYSTVFPWETSVAFESAATDLPYTLISSVLCLI